MENEMSLNDFAAQYFDGIEVPSGINLPTHRRELRNLLVAGTGSRQDARLGRRPVAGKVHSLSLKTWRGVLDQHSVLKQVVFTAIALVLVLSLFFVVPPLFDTHGSIPVSASEIALADLRVRATFTASDLQHLGTQEMAGENGQKIVILSGDSGTMVMVGVDMAAKKVNQWLLNTVGLPSSQPQLVFSSLMNGASGVHYGINVVNTDGSASTPLLYNSSENTYPGWSQARQQFAVVSDSNGAYVLSTIGYDGSQPAPLVSSIGNSGTIYDIKAPAWSPDGTRLAFSASNGVGYDIYTVTGPGLNQGLTRLTTSASSGGNWPWWSPDGSQIAYTTYRDGKYTIDVMNTDGTGHKTIAEGIGGICFRLSWSPDARCITFATGPVNTDPFDTWEIYAVNIDGTGLVQLTDNKFEEMAPALSPDGTKIAFYSNRDGYLAIYVMQSDGSGATRLTGNSISCTIPQWSPDGTQIAYLGANGSSSIPSYGLYVMNADGTSQRKLAACNGSTTFNWALLPDHPVAVTSTGVTATPPPLTAVPQTVVTVDAPYSYSPTTVALSPTKWPVSQQQAIKQALGFVPAFVTGQAKVKIGIGWSAPGWGLGEPYWVITLTGFSLTQEDLGWEAVDNINSVNGVRVESLPVTILDGAGPYTEAVITLSGLNGALRYRFAFMTMPQYLSVG